MAKVIARRVRAKAHLMLMTSRIFILYVDTINIKINMKTNVKTWRRLPNGLIMLINIKYLVVLVLLLLHHLKNQLDLQLMDQLKILRVLYTLITSLDVQSKTLWFVMTTTTTRIIRLQFANTTQLRIIIQPNVKGMILYLQFFLLVATMMVLRLHVDVVMLIMNKVINNVQTTVVKLSKLKFFHFQFPTRTVDAMYLLECHLTYDGVARPENHNLLWTSWCNEIGYFLFRFFICCKLDCTT